VAAVLDLVLENGWLVDGISHVLVNRTKDVESGALLGTEKSKVIGKENR
jgi:hypothetical protein